MTGALAKIKSEQYNLILLNIKLLGMSGIELYRRIQGMSGSLASRVIFITGDVIGISTRGFFSRTGVPYFTKPLDIEQLKREINSKLRQGA
ncbi:MAG: response regulator [Dehalococcoidales bacterium]